MFTFRADADTDVSGWKIKNFYVSADIKDPGMSDTSVSAESLNATAIAGTY